MVQQDGWVMVVRGYPGQDFCLQRAVAVSTSANLHKVFAGIKSSGIRGLQGKKGMKAGMLYGYKQHRKKGRDLGLAFLFNC